MTRDGISWMKDFLRAASDIGKSKSSSLNQLQWLAAMFTAAIVTLQFAPHALGGITVFFAVLLALTTGVLLVAYLFFMLKNPHSLRSESFEVQMVKLLQKRETEMKRGKFEEISNIRDLLLKALQKSEEEEQK